MRIALASLFAICYLLFAIPQAEAAFSQAYIRLDRLKASTALSGLVCAKPASSGTEAKVSIEFPSDITISSSTSNWTASTSDIPTGATAWSGIGSTATSVSSQTVTFASSDLTVGTLYCFNFSSSSSSTGSSGEKSGTITSKNSSDTTIDSTNYAVSIVANDQITVSATVPPDTWDFQNSLSSPTGGEVSQDKEVEYKINYGLNSSSSSDITLQAQWYQGTIEGEGSESVDILEYVVGSAEKAYNSTNPTIDTVNRKITWTISSFPGLTTDKTVSFKLRTTSNYTGGKIVSFNVKSRVISGTSSSTDSNIGKKYKYAAPTSSPTPTPTPTTSSAPFTIKSVEIVNVSKSGATVEIKTSNKSTVTLRYGSSLSNLSKTITTLIPALSNSLEISVSDPSTNYYFRFSAKDENGKVAQSDIFTFKSADISETPVISPQSFIAVSHNTIVSKPTSDRNIIILPKNAIYEFKFALESATQVKSAIAIVRSKNVLGFTTLDVAEASSEQTSLIEVQPGIFSGRLKAPGFPGIYEIYARIHDFSGNITEKKLAEVKVVKKFRVSAKDTSKPIEDARILLYLYNERSRTYEVLPPTAISVLNPVFTDSLGEADLVLPQAKYRALVSNIGYKDRMVEFSINPSSEGFPDVYLEKDQIGIVEIANYIQRGLSDVFVKNTALYVTSLTGSVRFFNLIAGLTLLCLLILTLFALLTRTKIPLLKLPHYFIFYLHRLNKNFANKYISGVIKDKKGNLVESANVYLTDLENDSIVSHTKTNNSGHFYFKKTLEKAGIMAMKKGYKTSHLTSFEKFDGIEFELDLEEIKRGKEEVLEVIKKLFNGIFGFSFEFLLLSSFVFELIFVQTFGALKTFPYILVSGINLFIWIMYLRIRHHSLRAN